MTGTGRDRVRELLDAVLAEDTGSLTEMASQAHSSAFHFSREVSRYAGEPPVALRRRVMLERAAWYLQRGATVNEVAHDAGYDSVEGFGRAFARAFGQPPGLVARAGPRAHWLPAPNGIHFHSPTVLYVDGGRQPDRTDDVAKEPAGDVLGLLVRHDLDDIGGLLTAATRLGDDAYRMPRLTGHRVLAWTGAEESIADVLDHLVCAKVPWLATIEGEDAPGTAPDDLAGLIDLHRTVAPRWLALVRDVDRRGAWSDRIIDALCDPPESFLLSQIVAHDLTFSAHRRQLVRWMLAQAGADAATGALDPDPIMWHHRRSGALGAG